jgi:hypothetical protein
MLENFLWPKLYDLFNEHGAENVSFQEDGATAHTSHRSLRILREIIFLGYLKVQVYQHCPQTLEGLKEAITQEVAAIMPQITCRVMEKYRRGSISVSTMKAAT